MTFACVLFGAILVFGLCDANLFGERTEARLRVLRDVYFTSGRLRPRQGPDWLVLLSTFPLDNQDTAAACEREGMKLVEITSEPQFNSIIGWLDSLSGYDGQQVHIAGEKVNGEFVFPGGQLMDYFRWHPQEPSGDGRENCLVLERRDGRYRMNDIRCNNWTQRYLCGKRAI